MESRWFPVVVHAHQRADPKVCWHTPPQADIGLSPSSKSKALESLERYPQRSKQTHSLLKLRVYPSRWPQLGMDGLPEIGCSNEAVDSLSLAAMFASQPDNCGRSTHHASLPFPPPRSFQRCPSFPHSSRPEHTGESVYRTVANRHRLAFAGGTSELSPAANPALTSLTLDNTRR